MSSSFLYRSLQAPAAATSAHVYRDSSHATPDRLLILHDTHISCCSVNSQGLEHVQTWKAPTSIAQLVLLPSNHILVVTQGGHCSLHSLTGVADSSAQLVAYTALQAAQDDSPNQQQPFGSVVSNVMSAPMGSGTASLLAVAYQDSALHVVRAAPTATGGMSLQNKVMPHKQVLLRCNFPDLPGSPLLSVRVHSRVLALLWLSPVEQQLDVQGNSLLAVLHEFSSSSQPPVLHVDCLAVDWQAGSLSPGPWSIRNVHPTTRLLHSFPGYGQLPAGTMLISSRGVLLCSVVSCKSSSAASQPGSSKAAAASPAADPQKVQLVEWALQGVPLSCASVSDNMYVVGDDRAGLYLMHLSVSGQATWQAITSTAPLAVPHVLVHIPLSSKDTSSNHANSTSVDGMQIDSPQQQQEEEGLQLTGLLFIGSRSSSSQVLGLPATLIKAQQHQQQQAGKQHQQPAVGCPLLQSAFMPSLAGAQAVVSLQDPTGALPEQQLLVACGAAPRAKLAVVRSGMGLTPFMLEGPEVPGDAVLFAIEEHPACPSSQQRHAHPPQPQQRQPQQHHLLGFSFPSAGVSHVMSLEGATFRQMTINGLRDDRPSLLMAGVPGGWLIQVTSDGVYILDQHTDRGLQQHWTPDGSFISLAAVSGSRLVVACGDRINAFSINCCSGAVEPAGSCQLQQQASALALLTFADGSCVIAVGLWVDNKLLLMPWPAPQQQQQQLDVGAVIDLHDDQARSAAVVPVGQEDLLLVGTNSGSVLLWHITTAARVHGSASSTTAASSSRWTLADGRRVQISSTSVGLQQLWLPPDNSGSSSSALDKPPVLAVYAHAGGGVVFSPVPQLAHSRQQQHDSQGAAAPAATDCVLVSRVCGSEGCLTAAHIHTPDMPHSLAWVSGTSRLCFGGIDSKHKLRWRSRPLQGTPLAMAVHRPTNTILLLLQGEDSGWGTLQQQQLVLLDGRSLNVLVVLGLPPGHSYTTLAVLELPCISEPQQREQQQQGSQTAGQSDGLAAQTGCMPFVVLGSRVSLDVDGTKSAGIRGKQAAACKELDAASASFAPGAISGRQGVNPPEAAAEPHPSPTEVGLLSFLELRTQMTKANQAGNSSNSHAAAAAAAAAGLANASSSAGAAGDELRYELVLHGLTPLPYTPASLCTVVPEDLHKPSTAMGQAVEQQKHAADVSSTAAATPGGQAAGGAGSSQAYLCVGSDSGVMLYDVVIDNAGAWRSAKLKATLAQAAQVTGMDLDSTPQASKPVLQQLQNKQQQDQRVSLLKVSECEVLSGGVVMDLKSSDSTIIATEALGSVTVIKALTTRAGRVQLLPVGADRSGLMAMDVVAPQPAVAAAASLLQAETAAVPAHGGPAQATSHAESADRAIPSGHQALLVATHPEGLLLLQRDLAAEQQHQQMAHEAAVQLFEAGGPAAGMLAQQQQQELMAAAVQPWLGAGEAAPWAAAGVEGRPHPHHLPETAAGPAGQRAALAATAAAAAGVLNPGAAEAPKLLPSSACAAAPGTSIMCQAQLGLHLQQLHQDIEPGSSSSSSGSSPAVGAPAPVWCFSPSGGVSVVQLLHSSDAQVLLQLQKQLLQQQPQHEEPQPALLRLQPSDSDGRSLQQLQKMGPTSSYRNYRRVRSARAAAEQQEAEEELPFNCVDGDLLFDTFRITTSGQQQDSHWLARLLQCRLWQAAL